MTKSWLSTGCVVDDRSDVRSIIYESSSDVERSPSGVVPFWTFQTWEVGEWSYDNSTTNSNAGKIGD